MLRVLLNRSNINTKSLSRLLQATAALFRHIPGDNPPQANNIILLMYELLADALRLKTRMLPFTLKSILEVRHCLIMCHDLATKFMEAITTAQTLGIVVGPFPSLFSLVDPGIHFLQAHMWLDISSENDFAASLAVAKMLLQVAGQDPSVMMKLADCGNEVCAQFFARLL